MSDDQIAELYLAGWTYRMIGANHKRISDIVKERGLRRRMRGPRLMAHVYRKSDVHGCGCEHCRALRRSRASKRSESERISLHFKREREARQAPPTLWRCCDQTQPIGVCRKCGSMPGWLKTG
jgi:hypothetical protein